jgi:hypothetical protein
MRIAPGNHSARISQPTPSILATQLNRFEFTFTPQARPPAQPDQIVLRQNGEVPAPRNPRGPGQRVEGRDLGLWIGP